MITPPSTDPKLQGPLTRRTFLALAACSAGAASLHGSAMLAESTGPVVFRTSVSTLPGDLVMAFGGGLASFRTVSVWRLEDGKPGLPDSTPVPFSSSPTLVDSLQPNDDVLKFQLPADWKPGLFAFDFKGMKPACLNRPLIWFVQPTELRPGLADNDVYPGCALQIIGKDFLLADDSGHCTLAIRQTGKPWQELATVTGERYSVLGRLPATIAPGEYQIAAHNGFGGVHGWSEPFSFRVKMPETWPTKVFNVRHAGALGDDVHDDTEAIKKALAEAEKNGGGVVYFPFGTYRLTGPIAIPARTILRGEMRDISILKWPEDEPLSPADFTPAAVYTASQFGLEDLTLIARKVDHTLLDISYENTHRNAVPKEFLPYMKPWSQYRDIFIRRVQFQHWLNAGHPDRNPDPKMEKKFFSGDGPHNILIGGCVNFEVSDCIFQGGNNVFFGPQNGRVTGNSFSNDMSYCWTCLGGGARRLVVSHNEIRASSSFGFGSLSLQWIYSAHNTSYNFVRGEREAMTLDVSSMPTKRAVAEYWGTPIEVNNSPDSVTLRFPAPSAPANLDGFRTGFLPGTFRGGQAVLHACDGAPGGGQIRNILDNTADTVTLDRPWNTPPETTPRRMYLELSPRKWENPGVTAAWVGKISRVESTKLSVKTANWVPGEFIDQQVLVLDGRGTGQYRIITANTETEVTLDRPWDVLPDAGAPIGIWGIVRHMIVYKSNAFDTSAFAQLYGSGYDYTVDSCHVERTQGIWGQMGWFVDFTRNDVSVGYSYHKGIGSPGPTPEHNQPFGVVGLNGPQLRLTKFGQVQYPDIKPGTAIFVDQLVGQPVPIALGTVVRRNRLRWNQRVVLGGSGNTKAPKRFRHATIDNNTIEHSAVGVQIGTDASEVLATANRFTDVQQQYLAANPVSLKVI